MRMVVVLPEGNDDPREWGWYQNATKTSLFMDNPTTAAATGQRVVSMSLGYGFL